MQTLNVDEVGQVRVNSRNLGFTQTWENNTKSPCPEQKRNMTPLFSVDLTFEWYANDMVSRVFIVTYYFCLESTVRKDTWIRTTSVTATVFFFASGILKVTCSQVCLKSLLNNYEAH